MTSREFASQAAQPEVVAYYGDGYRARRDGLCRGLEQSSTVTLADERSLSDADQIADDQFALVFTDAVPEAEIAAQLAGQSSVWVTTDADVAAAGAEHGVSDVFNWAPDDGWEMLAVKLRHHVNGGAGDHGNGTGTAPAQALQRISDGVLSLDGEFRITYLNEEMATILCGTDADVYGNPVWDYLSADVTVQLRPAFETALREGEPTTTKVEVAETGEWFEVTAYPSTAGLSVYAREITERKERETQESKYEHLVKTVGDAVYLLDDEGRFTFVNDALCEMTGYDREELLGSSVHIIKDEETVTEAEEALADLLRRRDAGEHTPIVKLDVELVTKDGERVPCTDRMTLRPIEDGEFTGTVGTLRDISRQRRRQEVLSGILETTQDMMAATTTAAVSDLVIETVTDVFGFEFVTLREHDPETDTLVPVASSQSVDEVMNDRPVYSVDEEPVGTAFSEDRLVVREDLGDIDDDRDRGGLDTGGYVPVGDRYTLSFGTREDGFSDDDLRLVELLAETAAAAFEAVAREEELQRYEAVVEAAEDKLFTLDEGGRITLATAPFAAGLGEDRGSLVGRDISAVVADADAAAEIARGSEEAAVETELLTGDGGRLPIRVRTARFEGPYENGVVASVQDISDLRSAQQAASRNRRRFTELFQTLSDPVADLAYGPDGVTVTQTNAAFAALCGETERSLEDQPLTVVQRALPDEVAGAIETARSPGESVETEVSTQTDTERKHYILKTIPYEGDERRRAFLILTDVTDLRQRETHQKVLYRLLRHNLRNQTTIIQGFAETMLNGDVPDPVVDKAERIYEASSSLVEAADTARTIQEVLEVDGEAIESVPVSEAVASVETEVAGEYPEADLSVGATTDGSVTFSHHLLTGIEELVDNAVTHADDPAPTVGVELADGPDPGTVTVYVRDDGPGIPRTEWEVVAGEREITQLEHGQGLGLWLVRWVVDKHSGDLDLERTGEDGTTVAVTLPR